MIRKNVSKMLMLVFCIVGCGGVTETIGPTESSLMSCGSAEDPVAIEGVRKVALFPLADYSHQQDFLQAEIWGGNIRILEEITDHFIVHGIAVNVQEDVNTLLVDNNIIEPIANQYLVYGSGGDDKREFRTKVIGTPEYDLVNVEHSQDMKEEIIEVIRDEMALEQAEKPPVQTPVLQGATVGLSREMVKQLGEKLGVDLIVRGRIIEYGFKGIDTYDPLKRGFLPLLIEPVKDVLFGAADAKRYESDLEDLDYSRLGEGVGFLFGQKSEDDIEGTWDVMMEHSFGTVANLHPRKKNVSTIVQIRLYAQDARTGNVIWSNRAETEFVPPTGISFNERHPKIMFDRNIRGCVKLLMDDLFSCISPVPKKKVDVQEELISGRETPIPDLEEGTRRELELKLAENEGLLRELENKIGSLENNKKILLQQIEDKTLITLPNAILFPSGTATLTEQGKKPLKAISQVLEGYSNRTICVEGHTDNVPIGPKIKDKYTTNWELSTARAIQVMNYMVKHFKFEQNHMSVMGYGQFRPVASNNTPEGKAQNRRVVIVVGSRI